MPVTRTPFFTSPRICAWALALLCCASAWPPAASAENGTTIAMEPCRLAAPGGRRVVRGECGSLSVPLDYEQPNGTSITLSVARLDALRRKPRDVAITVIAGGPGQSSLEFYAAYYPAFQRMREEFDIILVDQRGTGDSHRLSCQMPEQSLGALWSIDETTRLARDCLQDLDADPRFFTTSVAVRDLDRVREALGYEQLSVYGISYGTRVAQHYLRRFPERTHSVILDGVVPVNEALGPDIPLVAQSALQAAFRRCDEEAACRDAFGDLPMRFRKLIDGLRAAPVDVALEHPLTGEPMDITIGHLDVAGAVRLLSYAPQTVSLLPLMIYEASEGNFVPLAAQALTVSADLVDAMAFGMHNAVVCAEDVPFFGRRDDAALDATYLGSEIVEGLVATCEVWPRGVMDDDFKLPFASDVPVLVMSGEADPVTPPEYGERVAAYLGNARHIVGPGQGHGQAPIGCVPKLMGDFVRERKLAALDVECLARQGADPFFVSFAGPQP